MNIHIHRWTKFAAAFLFLCILLLSSCSRQTSGTDIILGTIVNIRIYGRMSQSKLDEALEAAMDRARNLEQTFSVNIADSELNYVNQNAFASPVKVSDDLYTVLEKSLYYANLTDGAFDPSLGRLIDLWGIGTDNARVPSADEISPLTGQNNYTHVLLDEVNHTVAFTTDDFSLDLGAIVKGYAADEIKKLLVEDYHIKSALINLGGNVITIGSNPEGSDWTIGIANPSAPEDSSASAAILTTTSQTLVTSGDYQRYFETSDGTRYHHILDGHTGYPADSGLTSVSIITDSSIDADALSTAVFVLGQEKGTELIQSLDGVEAVFIDTSGSMTATDGLAGQLTPGTLPLN